MFTPAVKFITACTHLLVTILEAFINQVGQGSNWQVVVLTALRRIKLFKAVQASHMT